MSGEQYLRGILTREAVDTGVYSPVRSVQQVIQPIITSWAPNVLNSVTPSGSFAKGTAIASGTDIDLFISLTPNLSATLKEIYNSLFSRMQDEGYKPRRQNVSIGIKVGKYDVDLVPAKQQNYGYSDHSLYRSRADTWTKTNVLRHISIVSGCGKLDEIKLIKIWRNQKNLDFPSFYLELAVIQALRMSLFMGLEANLQNVFIYLRDRLPGARFVDPANTNNVVSDDLTAAAKTAISNAAKAAAAATIWGEVIR